MLKTNLNHANHVSLIDKIMIYTLIYILILLIGCLIGIFKYRDLNRSSKIFAVLLFTTFFTEIIAQVILRLLLHRPNNFFMYHIFTPIQFSLIACAFFEELKVKFIIYLIPLMLVLAIILSSTIQPFDVFNSYFTNISFFFITIFTVIYFQKLLNFVTEDTFTDFPLFWISCGLMLFTISNTFVFGTFNTFFSSNNIFSSIFRYVRIFTNYILYILFIVAFLNKQSFIQPNDTRK